MGEIEYKPDREGVTMADLPRIFNTPKRRRYMVRCAMATLEHLKGIKSASRRDPAPRALSKQDSAAKSISSRKRPQGSMFPRGAALRSAKPRCPVPSASDR